ncbi:MAG TPA: ImmA/IrrE family metallo-endopeptidase [Bacillus bacterium]|nr:ImmA/IrrE family metallo-endopeptidase [Bacillus sp. (in: firmicutes)]
MSWINEIVQDLIEKYRTNNPFELADYLNVHVVFWDLHEEVNGFYKYDRRNKYIIINNNLDETSQKFTCAHELGHAKLHPRTNTPFLRKNTFFSTGKIEREANEFATYLLLYDKNLEDYETRFDVLKECGVPYEMERFL